MTSLLTFSACGRDWRLEKADMEALWEAMADSSPGPEVWGQDERLPYWAELWPSSLALAQWLEQMQPSLAGTACLDVGCGLGFTALVGQWLGARVTAMDYDAEALVYARRNARHNNISGIVWEQRDWRQLESISQQWSSLWAADIMYEKAFSHPIARFLAHCLEPEGVCWIAEPQRTVFQELIAALPEHGLVAAQVYTASIWPLTQQEVPVPVNIWEIRHQAS